MKKSILIFLILLPIIGVSQRNNTEINNDTNMQVDDVIKLYDAKGNEYSYSKKDYGENILPNQIKKVWNNPDSLYSLIASSLADGFNKELIDAGQRLILIDKDTSRAYTAMGVIYLKNNQLDEAEQTLLKGINVCSAKVYLKTNLAKVYDAKGLTEKSYNTLWESIELDPNQDNAVIWIGAIHKEKGGREEYLRIMRKISEIPSSWRAQLWIARDYLDNKENGNALKIYQTILPKVTNEPDAMMIISGDLGKHGLNSEIMTMIYPLYDLNKQDYRTGLNIIAACIDSKNKTIGFKVLNEIRALNRYDLIAYIAQLENWLNEIKE